MSSGKGTIQPTLDVDLNKESWAELRGLVKGLAGDVGKLTSDIRGLTSGLGELVKVQKDAAEVSAKMRALSAESAAARKDEARSAREAAAALKAENAARKEAATIASTAEKEQAREVRIVDSVAARNLRRGETASAGQAPQWEAPAAPRAPFKDVWHRERRAEIAAQQGARRDRVVSAVRGVPSGWGTFEARAGAALAEQDRFDRDWARARRTDRIAREGMVPSGWAKFEQRSEEALKAEAAEAQQAARSQIRAASSRGGGRGSGGASLFGTLGRFGRYGVAGYAAQQVGNALFAPAIHGVGGVGSGLGSAGIVGGALAGAGLGVGLNALVAAGGGGLGAGVGGAATAGLSAAGFGGGAMAGAKLLGPAGAAIGFLGGKAAGALAGTALGLAPQGLDIRRQLQAFTGLGVSGIAGGQLADDLGRDFGHRTIEGQRMHDMLRRATDWGIGPTEALAMQSQAQLAAGRFVSPAGFGKGSEGALYAAQRLGIDAGTMGGVGLLAARAAGGWGGVSLNAELDTAARAGAGFGPRGVQELAGWMAGEAESGRRTGNRGSSAGYEKLQTTLGGYFGTDAAGPAAQGFLSHLREIAENGPEGVADVIALRSFGGLPTSGPVSTGQIRDMLSRVQNVNPAAGWDKRLFQGLGNLSGGGPLGDVIGGGELRGLGLPGAVDAARDAFARGSGAAPFATISGDSQDWLNAISTKGIVAAMQGTTDKDVAGSARNEFASAQVGVRMTEIVNRIEANAIGLADSVSKCDAALKSYVAVVEIATSALQLALKIVP